MDTSGNETIASETIEVIVPAGTNTNQITLQSIPNPFDANTATYNVYRARVSPNGGGGDVGSGNSSGSPTQISTGNTPPANCATLSITDTGSAVTGGGGSAGSGNPPPSELHIKTRVYYQLAGESIWRFGAETNDGSQNSLTFHLPHNIQGQQISVQLRHAYLGGMETPSGLAPTKSYTVAAAFPSALGIGAAPPAGSIFAKGGVKIIDNSGNFGLGSIPDDTTTSRFAVLSIDANRRALIDFTQSGHLSKNLDNVPDTASRVAIAATHASGNVAYNFKGVWSSATSYVIGDEVTDNNVYWIALVANSNSRPSISNANWQAVGRIQGDLQIFTSNGTWVKPPAGTLAIITVVGGGGGGSISSGTPNTGGIGGTGSPIRGTPLTGGNNGNPPAAGTSASSNEASGGGGGGGSDGGTAQTGATGGNYGGGGGGGGAAATGNNGGAGAPGIVIVEVH